MSLDQSHHGINLRRRIDLMARIDPAKTQAVWNFSLASLNQQAIYEKTSSVVAKRAVETLVQRPGLYAPNRIEPAGFHESGEPPLGTLDQNKKK